MTIIADTNFLVGYYDPNDQYHDQAIRILHSLLPQSPKLVLSDYIYDETMTFLLTSHHPNGYILAQKFDTHIMESDSFMLIRLNDELFAQAREIFLRFNKDKTWSFTDCTTYALMDDLGIQRILTFDKHFKEMGFTIM